MRFAPKSEKQIQEERFPLIKPGKYHFEVLEASEKMSKKGNAMIELKLKIMDRELNMITYIKDYLMETIAYKLRHAAYACNFADAYERGDLGSEEFVGHVGMVEIVVQKDKENKYPDKNSIQDYIVDPKNNPENQKREPSWDDDMPEPPEWVR